MPAPPNYVFTVFAFISFFLCLIKFPTQFHAWSVGTHLYLAWVGLACLFLGINSIIWNHNTVNWAPVWCDITSRFLIGIATSVPAVVLCINRRLYLLASPTSINPSQADKNRELIIDLVIGIGLPIIVMVLSYFAQGSRFIIVEDYGCSTSFFPSWVELVIVPIPSVLLELIAGVYGCLSIHAFYNRSELNETLSSHKNLNSNRYARLICFSVGDILVGIPVTVFYLYLDITGLEPFPGLAQEHYQFSQISQVPAAFWRASTLNELSFELNRWILVWGAFVFFAIFGFTEESRDNYRAVLQSVVKVFVRITGVKSRPISKPKAEEILFRVYNSHASEDLPDS